MGICCGSAPNQAREQYPEPEEEETKIQKPEVNKNHIWYCKTDVPDKIIRDYKLSNSLRTDHEMALEGDVPFFCQQAMTNHGKLFLFGGHANGGACKLTFELVKDGFKLEERA